MDKAEIFAAIALTVALIALVVAVVARIDASVNSESIERMAKRQFEKILDANRVEYEVEQIKRHCRRCRKWSRK